MHNLAALRREIIPMKTSVISVCIGLSLFAAGPAWSADEHHCGWLANLAYQDWWLADADHKWLISEPDGYEAEGIEKMPDITTGEYTATTDTGNYGYTCACVHGSTETDASRFSRIIWVEPKEMAQCESDLNLPPPPEKSDQQQP